MVLFSPSKILSKVGSVNYTSQSGGKTGMDEW
jgi:hypothetical protein